MTEADIYEKLFTKEGYFISSDIMRSKDFNITKEIFYKYLLLKYDVGTGRKLNNGNYYSYSIKLNSGCQHKDEKLANLLALINGLENNND